MKFSPLHHYIQSGSGTHPASCKVQLPVRYEGASKSFQTKPIMNYMLTTVNVHQEATQSAQLHPGAESCTTHSSHSGWTIQKLLDISSMNLVYP
jgi:hypothetical protein